MAKTSRRSRGKTLVKTVDHSFAGELIHNSILVGLPDEERTAIFSKLEFIHLRPQFILSEMGEPIKYGYFINSGLASIVNMMSGEKSVEVGLTGKEGFVGLPLIVGFAMSPARAIIQIAGTAFRVSAKDFQNVLRACPELEKRLNRYSQELALQSAQIAACNRLHDVEERLARWLLMSQDRMGASSFKLTQESLSNMLGSRRASVTIAAGILQKAGLISYRRGLVKIEKRAKAGRCRLCMLPHTRSAIKNVA